MNSDLKNFPANQFDGLAVNAQRSHSGSTCNVPELLNELHGCGPTPREWALYGFGLVVALVGFYALIC